MEKISEQSIQGFLDDLASQSATPGGGSAAAVMGGLAAALVSMVCNLTVGKPKYAAVELEMQKVRDRAEILRDQLTALIAADITAFDRLMAAYSLPKQSEVDIQVRSQSIQDALKEATEIPLQCVGMCAEIIGLCRTAADKGNIGVVSDAGVGVMAAYAAVKSAALNVYVNTSALKDRQFAEQKLAELNVILVGIEVKTDEIYRIVADKL